MIQKPECLCIHRLFVSLFDWLCSFGREIITRVLFSVQCSFGRNNIRVFSIL